MKILSIDIETTGINPETSQILSIGLVIEDTKNPLSFEKIPKLHMVIPHSRIFGDIYAINLNQDLISLISKYHLCKTDSERNELADINNVLFVSEDNVASVIGSFLFENNIQDKITVAGKNYSGFDHQFLKRLKDWDKLNFSRRVIDPAILFVDWHNDDELPDLATCKLRADIEGAVTHNAVEDAFDVISILRRTYLI